MNSICEAYNNFLDDYFDRFDTYAGCPTFEQYYEVFMVVFRHKEVEPIADPGADLSALFEGINNVSPT